MIKKLFILFHLILISFFAKSQSDTLWSYSIEARAIGSPQNKMPFWLRSGQFGVIPPSGSSGALLGNIYKSYDPLKQKNFDWAAGIEMYGYTGSRSTLTLVQGYVKARKGIFELKAGRTKDIYGLVDSTLSSGSFSVSGNALGIPKIELGLPEFYQLPFFNKLIAAKASFGLGWVGDEPEINDKRPEITHDTLKYLQNSIYIRIGRPAAKLKLLGGITHHVMFGDERRTYNLDISPISTFVYAAIGKTFNGDSKVGNHMGSIDMAFQYDFENVRLFVYRQNIFDVGAIAHLANFPDGINGISLTNKQVSQSAFKWKKLLFEIVYTKNQAGGFNSHVKSGDEDYYNNFEYTHGWTYYDINVGNPLLTSRAYTRAGLINDPGDFIINNRVIAFHVGIQADYKKINFLAKLTYSQNYGTYGTAVEGHSTDSKHAPPRFGLFNEVKQFSGYLETNRELKNNFSVSVALAGDAGGLFYNSGAVELKIKKSFY